MSSAICDNKKAFHDYFMEERCDAGMVLEGWEVKSIRAHRVQIRDSHIVIRKGEAWLIGAHISPLTSASTHINPNPERSRKLLLHKAQLNKLIGAVERKGYTLVPLKLFWHKQRVKCEIALARGKKQFDKRATIKKREWERQKHRTLKNRR